MTISIKPTATGSTIEQNSSTILTVDGSGNLTVTNDFTVDTNTLHVDATNNRVGIGTSSPAVPIDIISSLDPVMRITSSGTGPNTGLSITKEQGSGDLADWNAITINGNDNVSYESRIQWVFDSIADGPAIGGKRTGGGETDLIFHTNSGETLYERVRIDSSGHFSVGASAGNPTSGGTKYYTGGTNYFWGNWVTSTVTKNQWTFNNPNGEVGRITTNGSSTSFLTSSDYRLKENNVLINDGITRVKLLKPYRFNFIVDADNTVDGFFAHEVQSVVPEAITGTHNEVDDEGNPVYQGIDQSKLVPLLTSALQEAITKIEDLEARVATLEGN